MKKFLSEIFLIQIVATYLVICGHSYPLESQIPNWLNNARAFLYTFHMPLFVWISGYLLIYTSQSLKTTVQGFLFKRFRKLIIPYIILSAFALVPKFIVQPYISDSFNFDIISIVRIFAVPRENVWGHFWFLPMIFIMGCIGFGADRLFCRFELRKIGWMALTSALFCVYVMTFKQDICGWFAINDLLAFGWFYSLGALCGCYKCLSRAYPRIGIFNSIMSFAVALIIYPPLCAQSIMLQAVIRAFVALLMIYSLSSLCVVVSRKLEINKDAVYAQTFTIFLLSWPCQAMVNIIIERLLGCPYCVIMPLQFVAGICGPIALILLVNQIENKFNIHWISFSLGK